MTDKVREALHELRKAVVGIVWEQLESYGDGSDFFVCQLCGSRTRDYQNSPHKEHCPMAVAKAALAASQPASAEGGVTMQVDPQSPPFKQEAGDAPSGQPVTSANERSPDLVIQRLPDWNWAAFLDETSPSCIAIGTTKEEAINNGMRELLKRAGSDLQAKLEALRELSEKATAGEWKAEFSDYGGYDCMTAAWYIKSGFTGIADLDCQQKNHADDPKVAANAALIVACVNTIRAILEGKA